MKNLKQKLSDRLGEQKAERWMRVLDHARVVKNIICWTMIIVIGIGIVVFMITRISGGTPSVFGYSLHRVVSGSMEPELEVGDVIVNRDVSDTADLAVGDIVSFSGVERFENKEVTHRILVAPYDDGRGRIVLVTKGDANPTDDGTIDVSCVKSKMVRKSYFLTRIYGFFFSPWGLATFLFLLLLVFLEEIVGLFRAIIHRSDDEESSESFLEIYRRLLREEKQKQKQSEKPSKSERTKSSKRIAMKKKSTGAARHKASRYAKKRKAAKSSPGRRGHYFDER